MAESHNLAEASPANNHLLYYTSSESPLGKSRKGLWLSALFGVGIILVGNKGSLIVAGVICVLLLMAFGAIEFSLRHKVANREPAVVLRPDAIESRLFSGKTKQYEWSRIEAISIEGNQNGRLLRFRLTASSLHPDRRAFWTGINPARPSLQLGSFEIATQEKLYDEINSRLRLRGANGRATECSENPITEERTFQEQLRSFAPTPWITYLLIAANVAIWLATLTAGASIAGTPTDKLLLWGGNAASEVQRGDWWRLVTAMFLHMGLMHVVMNMLGFASVGITVERIYGHRLFLIIYLGSGLIGNALSLHFAAQQGVSVGASGAVFGVMGALLVGLYQHRDRLPKTFGSRTLSSLGFFISYSLLQGFSHQGIDNAAHVGGLLGGSLLAFVLPARFNIDRFAKVFRFRVLTATVIAFVVLYGLVVTSPTAAVDQKQVVEGNVQFLKGVNEFRNVINVMQLDEKQVKDGTLTKHEVDDRSRKVFAPLLRSTLQDLAHAYLPPSDPRSKVKADLTQITKLLLELAEMPSVYRNGASDPTPADPERAAAIEAELKRVNRQLQEHTVEVKEKRKP